MMDSNAIARTVTSLCIAALMNLSLSAAEVAQAPRGSCQAVSVATMPKIDGTLDDPLWGKSPVLVLGAPASQQPDKASTTTARILLAPGHICFAVQCLDPDTDALKADAKGRDGQVWMDDCAEVFISPDILKFGYLHIAVNPLGTVFDQRFRGFMGDARFNTKARISASVQKGRGWTVSMAIPFSELEAVAGENQTWRLNITRTQPRARRESSWSTLADDDSHRPDCFGFVRAVTIPAGEGSQGPARRPIADSGIHEGNSPADVLKMYEWNFDRPGRDYLWEGFRETGKTWKRSAGAVRAPRSLALSASLSGALCNLPSAVVRRYDHSRLTRNRYFGLAYYVEDISALTLTFYNASQHVTMTARIDPARQKSWTHAWFNLLHNVSGGSPFPSHVRPGDRLTKVTIQGEPSGKNPVLILDGIAVFERQDVDVSLPEQRVLPATAFNRVRIRAYTASDGSPAAMSPPKATIPPLPAGKNHAVTFVFDHPVRPAPDLWEARKLAEYGWKGTWLLRGHDPEALKRIPELEKLGMEIGGLPASAYDLNSYSYARDLEEAVTGRLALQKAVSGPVLCFENCDDTRRQSYVPFWAGTFCMRSARDAGYLIQPTWGKYCYLDYYPRLHWYRDIATAAIQLYADRPGPREQQSVFLGRPHEAYGWEENYSQPVTGSREFYGKISEFQRAQGATTDKFNQLLYRIRYWDLGRAIVLKSLGLQPDARGGFEQVLKGYSGKQDVWYATLGEIGTYEYLRSRCRVVPDASATSRGQVGLVLEMADYRPDWIRQNLSVGLQTDAEIRRVEVEGQSVPLRKRPGETGFDIPLKFLRREVLRARIAGRRKVISAPDAEEITLSLENPSGESVSVEVQWTFPPEWGWKIAPLRRNTAIRLAGGESKTVSYRLTTTRESGFGIWPLTARLKIAWAGALVYQYVARELVIAPKVTADVLPYLPVFLRPGGKIRMQLVLDRSAQTPTHAYSAFEGKRTVPRFVCQSEKKVLRGVVRVPSHPAFKIKPAEQRVEIPSDGPVRIDFLVENVAPPADPQAPFKFLPRLELEGAGTVGLAPDPTDIYVDRGLDYKPLDARGLVFYAPFDGKGDARCVGSRRCVLRKDIDNNPNVQPKPPTWVEGKKGSSLAVSAAWYDAEKHFNALEGTALFWFKQPKEAQKEHCGILMVGGNVTGSWYICRLVLHRGKLSFSYVFLGNEENVVETPWPDDQAWHAVGVVWSSYRKCLQLYVDGKLAAEEKAGRGQWLMMPLQSSRHFRDFPGWKYYYKSEYEGTLRGADLEVFFKWKAKPSAIDELYIFDRALSAERIRRHIEEGN